MIVNVNLIKENITQCKSRITENVDVSVKVCSNQVYEKKKIMLGILLHVLIRKMNI